MLRDLTTFAKSPHIVRHYGVETEDKNDFGFFMEYCPGGELADLMLKRNEEAQFLFEVDVWGFFS